MTKSHRWQRRNHPVRINPTTVGHRQWRRCGGGLQVGGGRGPLEWERFTADGAAVIPLEVAVSMEEDGEGVDVVVETELAHGPEDVLRGDGLALLALAAVVGLAGDEADVLRHALLDRLLGVVGDLGMRREDLAHDADHVRDWHEPVLLPDRALLLLLGAAAATAAAVGVGAGAAVG